jgi:branched-chain amino acid transport system permease protein
MTYWVVQIVNGLSFGMVLFMISSGLSLIFGLMRIINLAHGCFYVWGVYVSLVILQATNNFLLSIMLGSLAIGILGMILQRFFLYRFQHSESSQVLLTLGFTFALSDLALWIWGGQHRAIVKPPIIGWSLDVGGMSFPFYRLIVIAVGVLVTIGLWVFQERTKVGALVRAGVDDSEMARGLGINVPLLFTGIFGLGAFLSAFGGIAGGLLTGIYPGAEWEILLLAMAVLILGGLGSLKGALVGSLFVALVDNFGRILFPEFALFTVFVPVAIILAFRPTGFFGKP